MKKSSGITIIILVVTLVIMGIIAGTVIFQATDNIKYANLKHLYNDLELLEDKVNLYYVKYNEIPIISKYDTDNYSSEFKDENINANKNLDDNNVYYILDLQAIGNLTLNNYITGVGDDVYVVNEETHTIYYPKGIVAGSTTYYSLPR